MSSLPNATPTVNSVNWTAPSNVKADVYATKAAITRKRRALADARLAAEFAQRQRAFQAKLDAIVAAKKGK